jgi:Cation/multidrug efflux pump
VNPADAPIMTLKLSSATVPLREINGIADSILAQRLAQVQGVGLVTIAGNVRPAVRIQVNPDQLSNMGMTLEDLRGALTRANVAAPKGTLNGTTQSYTIGTNDQLTSAAAYAETVIRYSNGRPVRLRDVATVVDGAENDQVAAWADGLPAVLLESAASPAPTSSPPSSR